MAKRKGEELPQPPARERLRAFLTRNPRATAAMAARALGVSRQRVHQIAAEEELELEKYPYQMPEEFFGSPAPGTQREVMPSVDDLTGHGTPAHRLAVLRVAGDLIAKGLDVYLPFERGEGAADLVTVNPETFECERLVVDVTKLRSSVEDANAPESRNRRVAIVGEDPSAIQYTPTFKTSRRMVTRRA